MFPVASAFQFNNRFVISEEKASLSLPASLPSLKVYLASWQEINHLRTWQMQDVLNARQTKLLHTLTTCMQGCTLHFAKKMYSYV